MLKTKEFILIFKNVPNIIVRLDNIHKVYIIEKELGKKHSAYVSNGYTQKVRNECPDYLKNNQKKWTQFVKTYIYFMEWIKEYKECISNFKKNIERPGTQLRLNF